MNHNSTTQVGRLSADPTFTPGKKEPDENGIRSDDRALTRLAVNRPKINGKDTGTDYFLLCAWGKLAHVLLNYCKKGKEVLVEGSIRTNPTMRPDGSWDNYMEIVAHKVVLGNSPKNKAIQPQPAQSALPSTIVDSIVSQVMAAVKQHMAQTQPIHKDASTSGTDNPFS